MRYALSLRDAIRYRFWLRVLDRPLTLRDRNPLLLFLLAFGVYWIIGEMISEFHGHDVCDRFFNSDVPRVITDMTETHFRPGSTTAPAHPLFALSNLIAAPLARILNRSTLLAALLLSHAGTALSVCFFYAILRRLGTVRWFSLGASLVFLFATSNLVFGSVVETFSFVPCALTIAVWAALTSFSPVRSAFAGVFTLGLNVALIPHALFAPLVIWSQRSSFRQWFVRLGRYWVCLLVVTAAAFYVQHRLYPEMNPLDSHVRAGYASYSEIPKTSQAISFRGKRLLAHMLAFDVVAPQPLLHDKITTFMWNGDEAPPAYTLLGKPLVLVWLFAFAVATYTNVRRVLEVRPEVRAVILLCAGWLFGVALLFVCYGDDMLLFSECWMAHIVLWVAVGLGNERVLGRGRRWLPVATALFVLLLAVNQADFMRRVLRYYQTSALITL